MRFNEKIWLASAVAVLMGVSLVGYGSTSNDETPSVDETESAEAEDAAADESEASDTLVIMAADGYTYNCQAVDTAYGTDAYGFANDSVWQVTDGQIIQMDIQYVASKSTGESYYQINVDQYVVSTESITWEAIGTYDAESNSLVFTDARNCDVAVYADGTTKETDIYTDASGSIYMDCNQRLYWEDEFGGLASCVFESDAIDYTYAVMEAGAIYGSYECSDGANTITADICIGEMADGITFEVSTSDGQTETFDGSLSYDMDPVYVFDMGDCSLKMIFIDNGETVRVVVDDGADEEYDVLAGYYTFTGESTYSDINWDEVS